MPRLAFEEPIGGPAKKKPTQHRRKSKRDGVVVVLKAATFAGVIALVGAVVLLVTTGGDDQAGTTPDVPEIETSHVPSPTTTPPPAIVAPEIRSETTQVVPTVPPSVTQPSEPSTTERPRDEEAQFAVVGEPCATRGDYSFTASYEPVVCGNRHPSQPLTWHLIFR